MVATTRKGTAINKTSLVIERSPKKLAIPITIDPLNKFEPKIFPIAMSPLPLLAARIVTASSGKDVPIAIADKAIAEVVIPSKVESSKAEVTVNLAPKTRKTALKIKVAIKERLIFSCAILALASSHFFFNSSEILSCLVLYR